MRSLSDIAPVERASADRVQIHFFRRTGFSMLSAYSLERIEAKSMAKSARNGAWTRQHKLHRVIVYLLHFANQIRSPMPSKYL